jgi:hypothetical protein
MTQLLTHSRLTSFRACPRKHFLRYEVGIAPEQDDFALRVGTAYHAALEAADLGQDPEAAITALGTLEPHDAAMVAAMFSVHRDYWSGQTLEVIATELQFEMPIVNPDTGHASRIWSIAGKIDRIYRLPSGLLAVQDYKTTTDDISPGSDLWLRLSLDQQMSIYVLAARALGHDVQAILYDVTVRPMLRPHKATPIEQRKYTQKATKLDDGTVRPAGSLYANQREVDETPEEFAARVAAAMRAEPERYFARHEIARLDRDLEETRYDIWTQQLAMREAQRSDRWFRNPSHCARCAYLAICGQNLQRNPACAPSGFRILPEVHSELARPEQAGHVAGGQVPPGV